LLAVAVAVAVAIAITEALAELAVIYLLGTVKPLEELVVHCRP
jgi:hypothetical protein